MNPAVSVIIFTTVAGAAQGLIAALASATLAGVAIGATFLNASLLVALSGLVVGLGASFLHLGHPERAWRAAMMWRTSWLSREVIVLPTFIGVVALWWLANRLDLHAPALVQKSMGISAGSFNTREFFHGVSARALRQIRWFGVALLFVLPGACMLWALAASSTPGASAAAWCLAALLQVPGLFADRWVFFAQTNHPQNLYYQLVS